MNLNLPTALPTVASGFRFIGFGGLEARVIIKEREVVVLPKLPTLTKIYVILGEQCGAHTCGGTLGHFAVN